MSTLTGLIGGGGGLISPTSSSYDNTSVANNTVFTAIETYNFGARSAGTFTILSLSGAGYIWYLKHTGDTPNVFRGADAKIVVDGSDIITQTSNNAGGTGNGSFIMVGNQGDGQIIIPVLPFTSSFSFQIIVTSSIQSADACNMQIGWCLKA